MLYIKKKEIKILVVFIIAHLLVFLISNIFNIEPFISWDDSKIYYPARIDTLFDVNSYLITRQFFIVIAAYLNSFIACGEWINGTRILNIILSYFIIIEVGKLCKTMGYKDIHTYNIMLFLAISPIIQLWMGSLYKDVLCAFLVLKIINIFICLKGTIINYIIGLICIIFLFFVRAGIVEILLAMLMIWYLINNKKLVRYIIIIFFVVILCGIIIKFGNQYNELLSQKVDGYIFNTTEETGLLSLIRVTTWKDWWKIPLCVIWLQISPVPSLNIVAPFDKISWMNLLSLLSIIQYYFIPYFWFYIFKNRKNRNEKFVLIFYLFWVLFISITELNNSRFYVFIAPFFYVFSIHSIILNKGNRRLKLIGASFCIIWFIFLLLSFYI